MGKIYELTSAQIEELLETAIIGRLACAVPDEPRPYLVPIGYRYDGEALYFLSAPGRKIELMRQQPLVAFEVDRGDADDRWQSVVCDGTYEELISPDGRAHALAILFPDAPPPPIAPHMILFRIVLTRKSGRGERPDAS